MVKPYPVLRLQSGSPMFSSHSYVVSLLCSIWNLFLCGVRNWSNFIFEWLFSSPNTVYGEVHLASSPSQMIWATTIVIYLFLYVVRSVPGLAVSVHWSFYQCHTVLFIGTLQCVLVSGRANISSSLFFAVVSWLFLRVSFSL